MLYNLTCAHFAFAVKNIHRRTDLHSSEARHSGELPVTGSAFPPVETKMAGMMTMIHQIGPVHALALQSI